MLPPWHSRIFIQQECAVDTRQERDVLILKRTIRINHRSKRLCRARRKPRNKSNCGNVSHYAKRFGCDRKLREDPPDFITSTQKIAAWHDFQAMDCESDRQWLGTAFHLQQVLASRPHDQLIIERLDRAKVKLNGSH